MAEYVIIVAGGKGLRMGGDIPKQFQLLGGKPVLMRTIERFREYSASLQVILVLPHEQQSLWSDLCSEYGCHVNHQVTDGGQTRFHSVQNGLKLIPEGVKGVVGVHDGVRPFVSSEVIGRCYDSAREHGAAVPVVPVVETLRKIGGGFSSVMVPRSDYRLVQTPQVFDISLLKEANKQPYRDTFTDDASVVEAYGCKVSLVEGNPENIKLTTPFDMLVGEALIAKSENSGAR